MSAPRPAPAAAYGGVVKRVRAMVEAALPEGSIVAVVSKGDANLLRFDGRRGWHFPRTSSGEYAGHHPGDGQDALKRLRETQNEGATHFLIPQTYAWWLEYYTELREHLERTASVAAQRADTGVVYTLRAPSPAVLPGSVASLAVLRSRQVAELLAHLLPEGCTVLLASAQPSPSPAVAGVAMRPFRFDGNPEAALAPALEEERARGADFLVVPASAEPGLARNRSLQRVLGRSYATLLHQSHVCTVYDLRSTVRWPAQTG